MRKAVSMVHRRDTVGNSVSSEPPDFNDDIVSKLQRMETK